MIKLSAAIIDNLKRLATTRFNVSLNTHEFINPKKKKKML